MPAAHPLTERAAGALLGGMKNQAEAQPTPYRPDRQPVTYRGVRYYYMPVGGYHKTECGELLHRAVYLHEVSAWVPDGWHVHHQDHDPGNNAPWNLSAMPPACHARHHTRLYETEEARKAAQKEAGRRYDATHREKRRLAARAYRAKRALAKE